MDGWYGAVDMIKARKSASLTDAFSEEQGWFRVVEPLERIFGLAEEELDAPTIREWFLPQLTIYFLRYLHFYDGALQGQSVDDFEVQGFTQERKQREQASAKSVKELLIKLKKGDFSFTALPGSDRKSVV